MTSSANTPVYFLQAAQHSAARAHSKPARRSAFGLAFLVAVFRRPLRRPAAILGMVGQESHAHGMRRAQSLLAPEEFELHAQRIALLRSAGEADLARECRKAWMAGTARAYRACVQSLKRGPR